MKHKSHRMLGQYLVRQHLTHLTPIHTHFFVLGCVQPDMNPATYIKGSVTFQFLRGHNFSCSNKYMERLSRRLEHKKSLTFLDYYMLGKLVHYAADAFTFSHNDHFPDNLKLHHVYEERLQKYFLSYLSQPHSAPDLQGCSAIDIIRNCHIQYRKEKSCVISDAKWSLHVCCAVVACLAAK